MERPKCKTCPYWDCHGELDDPNPDDYEPVEGECRRRAPMPLSDMANNEPHADWPLTMQADWCGEHPDFPEYLASLKQPVTSGESHI